MKESLKDHARFAEADVAFHDALSQAAGNRVSQLVLQVLQRAMLTSIAQTSGLTRPENSLAFHRAIYRAVQRRDPDQARQKMIAHFEFGRDTLLRAAKEEPIDLGQKIRAIRRPRSTAKI
jgi:DNA-binding FadR family transcriptional regulator